MSGPDNLTYAYDGLGRRIEVTRNGQTTTTLYDGWNPIQLQQGATVIENRLTGPGPDETYARTRGGVTESYLTDALGSTVELRDGAQAQTTQYTYEPYGGTAQSAPSTNVAKYTGREQDAADLYYYRHRYYKPSVGRFGLGGGINTYLYANANPISFTDPYGLWTWPGPADVVNYWGEFLGGAGDFGQAYSDQWRATNTVGGAHHGWANQDVYFHCRANCEAAQRGPGGEDAAQCIGDARENWDELWGQSPADTRRDQAANLLGRSGGSMNPGTSCQQICGSLRPGGSFPAGW